MSLTTVMCHLLTSHVTQCRRVSLTAVTSHLLPSRVTHWCHASPTAIICHPQPPLLVLFIQCRHASPTAIKCHQLPSNVTNCRQMSPTAVTVHPVCVVSRVDVTCLRLCHVSLAHCHHVSFQHKLIPGRSDGCVAPEVTECQVRR